MISKKISAAMVLALALIGCENAKQPIVRANISEKAEIPYQRFVPIPPSGNITGVPWHGSVALDTKTGRLCSTLPSRTGNWETLPRCFDLYEYGEAQTLLEPKDKKR
jgi:uncharacterized lipoprotein NlpE involved in copper resistance